MNNFGLKLKELRMENNLSQRKIAKKLGITRQAVNLWEKGITQPRISRLKEIAYLLSCKPDQLFMNLFTK